MNLNDISSLTTGGGAHSRHMMIDDAFDSLICRALERRIITKQNGLFSNPSDWVGDI